MALALLPLGCIAAGSSGSSGIDDGTGDTIDQALVVINEVDCRGREWVELVLAAPETADPLNPVEQVDLSGWVLTDDPNDETHRYTLAQGTVISAGEFLVIEEESDEVDGFPFGIKCGEDRLSLLFADGSEAAGVDVPEIESGQTWGRLPDGSGSFQTTSATPGEANLVYTDLTQDLFDPFQVGQLALTIDQASIESLRGQPYEYVAATFNYTAPDGQTEGPYDVGVRLKGRAGSLRPLDDKPGFKVLMDFSVSGQEFYGLTRLTLNNLVQDPTMIREAVVYRLFRELDVPAPRVGYVQVTINGEDYGLYANLETPDRTFLSRWFDSTNHLYEGVYGADILPDAIDMFEVDVGDETDHSGLETLAQALWSSPPDDVLSATENLVDWDEALTMMAVEIWSGHWDAYAPSANNYFLHEDGYGRFSLLPWGADQAFTAPMPLHSGRGLLFHRCMADPVCLERYDRTLLDLQEALEELDLPGDVQSLADDLAGWVTQDERKPFSDEQVQEGYLALLSFIEDRIGMLEQAMPCLDGTVVDQDGDGYVCEMDCDESDTTIHFGATELCDGIDQDCNGEPDDRPECPDCSAIDRDGHAYLVCTRHRPHWEAQERCAEEGMNLVKLESAEEERWLIGQAQSIRPGLYWIGLTVPEGEGADQHLWWDGSEPDYTHWAEEQPMEEHRGRCAVMVESGEWLAVDCEFPARTLCEE